MSKTTPQPLYYAAAGDRNAPADALDTMIALGEALARKGFTLRVGGDEGPDQAFLQGAKNARKYRHAKIYIPWRGYNGYGEPWEGFGDCPARVPDEVTYRKGYDLCKRLHPTWHRCKEAITLLHARKPAFVLGPRFKTPAAFVVCWRDGDEPGGNTAMTIRIAEEFSIPVFNLRETSTDDVLATADGLATGAAA